MKKLSVVRIFLGFLVGTLALSGCLPDSNASWLMGLSAVGVGPQPGGSIYLPLITSENTVSGQPGVPTPTVELGPSATPTTPPSATPTDTVTSTPTDLPTSTPTFTLTPTITLTPSKTPKPSKTPSSTPTVVSNDPVLIGAGDIARCGSSGSSQTGKLLAKNPGTVFTLGDNAYESGTATEFATCYDPFWGPFKAVTMPSVGNHDYITTGATGYFGYYGAVAAGPGGYYSYNLGAWHIIALNSDCGGAGGCGTNSPQGKWLAADLKANPTACAAAYWHHPFYSSGEWGDNAYMLPLVTILYNNGVDVMMSGHDHDYERFAPQDLSGNLDTAKGIVQFVAGTGGSNNTPWTVVQPNSLVRQNTSFGLLKFTLHPTSYDWKFIPVSGSFSDAGTMQCH